METKATQALANELIETLKDGQKGYAEAITDVEDADLKETFKKYAAQRSGYITELEDQMHKLNLHPEEESSVTGTIHRAFINLKSIVTSKDRHSILAECERGEDYAKKAYQTALKAQDLPAGLKTVIEKQYQGIQQGHDEMRSLRDASEKK
ncbi:PA2169 family four-helix-bundle protein [Hymenobacter fastidiosus]|uniref:PA2169 family four-helix-bundle protein n=1 Tax=Hymenobacter fastidiosus TaxID=486264 RepID=A0ABP7R939_9BACT